VRAAAQPQVLDGRRPAIGVRLRVIELQEPAFTASAAVAADERALLGVSLPDRPPDGGRDISRAAAPAAARSGLLHGPELFPLDHPQQRPERPIDHRRHVAIRNPMPQEILRPAQLRVRLGARRELDSITAGRERLDDRRS
jgi:hypothetical protein